MLFHHGAPVAGLQECLAGQLREVSSVMQIRRPSRTLPSGRYRLHTEAFETPDGALITGEVQVLRPVWICSW